MSKKERCQTLKTIMNSLEDVDLSDKKGGRFYFTMHMTKAGV